MPNLNPSNENSAPRTQKKTRRTMKVLVTTALVLSSISIVMSAYATNQILHGSRTSEGAKLLATQPAIQTVNPADKSAITDGNQEAQLPENTEPAAKDSNEAPVVVVDNAITEAPQKEIPSSKVAVPKKVVYLTFDDGPSKYTDTIVDILKDRGIHATFFMIGTQLSEHEDAVNRTIEYGNYVGLHSMSHSKKKLYQSGSSDQFIKEYKQEQALMKKITGTTPWLIRAPYGSKPGIDADFRDKIVDAKFKMWDWTVDSKDWYYTGKPDKIIQEVQRQVHRDTEVILLHEKSQTVQALSDLIAYLEKKGYAFAVYKPELHFPVNFAKDERL